MYKQYVTQIVFFWDLVGAWPGSVHDSRIFKNCAMYDSLIAGNNGILLGDNGYPILPFLMTPFLNPASPEEEHYNRVHKRARCTAERAFGQLKRQFYCLDSGLRCNIERISSTIIVCFILHSFSSSFGCSHLGVATVDVISNIRTEDLAVFCAGCPS